MELLLFLTMPIFVKIVILIRTYITVYLMVSLTVNIFERMRTRLAFLCSEPWRIYIIVLLIAPYFIPIILRFVKSIAFDIPRHMQLAT